MKYQIAGLIITIAISSPLVASNTLQSVVVSAKSQQEMIDTAGSFTIITSDEIAKTGATNLAEILKEFAGASTGVNASSYQGRSSISLRGMDSKHSLILIDSKRISSSDGLIGLSDFSYNYLPLEAIDRIEVIRGAMSSLYGSQAIGGVINIITKKPSRDLSLHLSTKKGFSDGIGGDSTHHALSISSNLTDDLAASLSAEVQEIDPIKSHHGDTLSKMEGKKLASGSLYLWYDIDPTQRVELSGILGNERRDNLKYKEYYDIDRSHYSIGYQKRFGEEFDLRLKYYASSLDAHSDDASILATHKLDDIVANAELATTALASNYIVLGLEEREEKYHKAYDNTPEKDFKNSIDYTSIYLQDEISLLDSLILTLGARYDKHEKFGSRVSPKAYVVYKLDESSRLKGGYAEGFNAPSLTQISADYTLAYPYITTPPMRFYRFSGNEDLKPEVSKSYEFGYEYLEDGRSLKATAFYTKVDDLVTFKDNGTTQVSPVIYYDEKIYSNVASATVYGLELEFEQKDLLAGLDLYVGYGYLHSRDDSTKESLSFRPKHKVDLRLDVPLPFEIYSSVGVNYVGKQYNSSQENLSAFTTVSLQAYKELYKGLKLHIGAQNLSNKKLADEYDYQIRPRLIYAKLDYTF